MAKKLLVVDDDPMGLRLLKDIATVAGHRVITAINGRQAVERAWQHIPDLILMDVMMPELDGYAALAELKSDEKTRDIPVVILTASDCGIEKNMAYKLGAADFIIKPLNVKHLISRISYHLTR